MTNKDGKHYLYISTNVHLITERPPKKSSHHFFCVNDYVGNYIYENNVLRQFSTPVGYVEPDGQGGYDYVYQYKDHLGNVRLSYSDADNNGQIDPSSEILQEQNYYPFGLQHKGYNSNINGVENNYMTYNGKELDESLGLNWLDYGWRNYDPSIARWMGIDNKSEDYLEWSPYNYTLNNPIFFVDPDGNGVDDVWSYNVDTNELEWVSDVGGDQVQIVNVTNNAGKDFGTRAIESSEVHIFETSKSVLISGYDHQIPDGYNRNTGNEYDATDLKTRRNLIESGYGNYVDALESSGNSGELSQEHFHENYVAKWGTNQAFYYGLEHYYAPDGTSVAGEALSALQKSGKSLAKSLGKSKQSFKNLPAKNKVANTGSGVSKGTLSGKTASSVSSATSGNAASARSANQIKSSWNKFLNQNKGKYSGKDWIKRAAADYKKLQATN